MPSIRSHPRRGLLRRRLFKPLGLSVFALVSLMAMGAPAQAQTLLVESNGVEVSPATIVTVVDQAFFLSELFNQIDCNGGYSTSTITRTGEGLMGEVSVAFTECDILWFKEYCDVRSPGQKLGVITTEGKGSIVMEGAKTYTLLDGIEFSILFGGGVFCPFNEYEAVIGGALTLTLDESEVEQVTRRALLDGEKLFNGESEADLEAFGGGPVGLLAELANGEPWAIVLD